MSARTRTYIDIELIRVVDVRGGDVIHLLDAPGRQTPRRSRIWRHVYGSSQGAGDEGVDTDALGFGDRDVALRVAEDYDRSEGDGTYIDRVIRFLNPYELVEIQRERQETP